MSNNLTVFAFSFEHETHDVRFVGTAENPEWIAQDVCNALGVSDVSSALRNFKPTQRGVCTMQTLGGEQQMLTVKESGLYKLVMKSRKPCAEKFQDWICEEVLPSIRKTGQYSIAKTPAELHLEQCQLFLEQERRMRGAEDKLASHDDRLGGVEAELGRFTNPHGRYYTICGYAALLDIEMPLLQAQTMGKRAAVICRKLGLPIGEVRDPRFGRVNTYPESVLQQLPW